MMSAGLPTKRDSGIEAQARTPHVKANWSHTSVHSGEAMHPTDPSRFRIDSGILKQFEDHYSVLKKACV